MQVMDLKHDSALHLKALIYGDSGSGKTTFGVTAPKPLILAAERQALVHIRQAQTRTGRDVIGALYMESLQDFLNVVRTLRLATASPESKRGPFIVKDEAGSVLFESAEWPESIVIDSITDVCKLIEADIDKLSPPKNGADGLPARSMRFWGVLGDKIEKFLRAFRDVDFHVLFLALKDDKTVGEDSDAVRIVGPSVPMRSVPGAIAAAVNVVGVMQRDMKPGKAPKDGEERPEATITHTVRTTGPNYMLLKPYRPLLDVEVPDFSDWVARITAGIATPVTLQITPTSRPIEVDVTKALSANIVTGEPSTPDTTAETFIEAVKEASQPATPSRRRRAPVTE
jgi:hypothetical protein